MANIREQCSWVHEDHRAATDKAAALTRAAVRRVALHEPLEKRYVDMNPATLVIGGGMAGMTAALELAGAEQPVFLVERERPPGRQRGARRPDRALPRLRARHAARTHHPRAGGSARAPAAESRRWRSSPGTSATSRRGSAPAPTATPKRSRPKVGSVIVCTGYEPFDAARVKAYGYGWFPNVITSFEFENDAARGAHPSPTRASRRSTSRSSTASAAAARNSIPTARASAA